MLHNCMSVLPLCKTHRRFIFVGYTIVKFLCRAQITVSLQCNFVLFFDVCKSITFAVSVENSLCHFQLRSVSLVVNKVHKLDQFFIKYHSPPQISTQYYPYRTTLIFLLTVFTNTFFTDRSC